MTAKKEYTAAEPVSGAAMILRHHNVDPASKAVYVLFFTIR
jgi:hypothetical protein